MHYTYGGYGKRGKHKSNKGKNKPKVVSIGVPGIHLKGIPGATEKLQRVPKPEPPPPPPPPSRPSITSERTRRWWEL